MNETPQIAGSSYETIDVTDGQDFELTCIAEGYPQPSMSWLHNGYFIESNSSISNLSFENNRTVLKITCANPKLHQGVFQCFATNELGSTYAIKVVNFKSSTNSDKASSNNKFLETGSIIPSASSPPIHHKDDNLNDLNGESVSEDEFLSEHSNKDHNGHDFSSTTHGPNRGHRKKHKNQNNSKYLAKMIPPSKPEVSKLSDDSVMVRWSLSSQNSQAQTIPVSFFKVQYKEVSNGNHGPGSDWNTLDAVISPHIYSYEVFGLNPNGTYRFRIAAVYANDDNKNGPSSPKFVMQKDPSVRRPSYSPSIINAKATSPTQVSVNWNFMNIEMLPINGFFIYYRPADSAGEYDKASISGDQMRQYNLSNLSPSTVYEIKMRCFNVAGVSDFSNIYTVQTLPDDNLVPPKFDSGNTGKKNEDVINHNSILDLTESWLSKTFKKLINDKMQFIVLVSVAVILVLVFVTCFVICIIRHKSNATLGTGDKIIKNGLKPATSPGHDFYFTPNLFERQKSNGTISKATTNGNGAPNGHVPNDCLNRPITQRHSPHKYDQDGLDSSHEVSIPNNNSNHMNVRVNPLSDQQAPQLPSVQPSTLNRRNSLRNSLSYSTHHLFNSSIHKSMANGFSENGTIEREKDHCKNINNNVATIDRKRMSKTIVDSYLESYAVPNSNGNVSKFAQNQHNSTSFTRLNGTLERKRRSRTDLNTLDRSSLLRSNGHLNNTTNGGHVYNHNGNGFDHHHYQGRSQGQAFLPSPQSSISGSNSNTINSNYNHHNAPIVIMQSSC